MTQEAGKESDILEKYETLYNWCLVNQIKPNKIINEDSFMLDEISYTEFKKYLDSGDYQENTYPQKPEKYLELRMYGLVPYNLSPIQQGIQFNHANDVYSVEWGTNNQQYDWFRTEWMTNMLYNGGTSNEGHYVRHGFKNEWYVGSMQQHLADLTTNGIRVSTFNEPDLNSMLTAIVFLVDERCFDKKLYEDFTFDKPLSEDATSTEVATWFKEKDEAYSKWLNFIGGEKNAFLREFLRGKKLA